jgi:hypothetical protein
MNSIIIPIFIGSQQTQHVELYNGDLDHVRQLMRSKHEAHSGEDNHLATAMDSPGPRRPIVWAPRGPTPSPLRFSGSFGEFLDVWLLFRPIPRIFSV